MAERANHLRDLPGGTVTLLFADVEGSTRLLSLLGERFAPARARMRELVRTAAADNAGAEVDWAGDGVFLAFSSARDALAAAAEIQRSLATEPWPHEESHRLRIGVHTGEPELGDEGYLGMDVVIAARVCASAHGEQVVVTRATRDLASDEPLPGRSFRPLGRHRLKDVPFAAELFQLLAPDLREDFPPLKTLSATTLPALHHRLVGRAEMLASVEGLLARPDTRWVTITGPGGAGKSRLALEVASRAVLERPVHLVGLAPVPDPELVPSAIARAIGVRESSQGPLLDAIADSLNGARALLFLDNLEHLEPSATHVAALLDRAPDLQILATSRTALRLSMEHVLLLAPLSVEDATTLFLELAAARGVFLQDDALASVHEICRRLDGLPLAIELVAARLAVLPPAEILRALQEGLALEMEGPVDLPERQRTLRAAIDWSYQRLSPSQRDLHGALAVFPESSALDDARAVSEAGREFLGDLEALVGWSLVRSESSDGELRLSMLETVREHARGHVRADGRLDELRQRHAERFLELAREAESHLARPGQAQWLERLEREFDNIGAALDWLLASRQIEDALRAIAALERFWRSHAHVIEARRWLALGLEQADEAPAEVRAYAVWTAARQAMAQHDYEAAEPLASEANQLFRATGHEREVVFSLCELAEIALVHGDIDRAVTLGAEAASLAGALGDARVLSSALQLQASTAAQRGEHRRALELYDEALALRRTLGDPLLVVDSAYNLGEAAFAAGDHDRAKVALENCLVMARELGDALHEAAAMCVLGEVAVLDGALDQAEDHLRESFAMYAELADDRSSAECLLGLAAVRASKGLDVEAARLWGASEALRGEYALLSGELRIVAHMEQMLSAGSQDGIEAAKRQGRHLADARGLRDIDVVARAATAE